MEHADVMNQKLGKGRRRKKEKDTKRDTGRQDKTEKMLWRCMVSVLVFPFAPVAEKCSERTRSHYWR